MACDRPLFMGDIIIDVDTTCSIETTSGVSSIVISKGSWFANAILFWAYIQQEHNDQTGDVLDFIIRIDNTYTNISFNILNLENTGDDILDDSIDNSTLATIVGWDDLASNEITTNIPYVFRPRYPLHTYNRSIDVLYNDTCVAEDGSVSGNVGIPVHNVEIGISLSGENQSSILAGEPYYQERFYWDQLWNTHWRKGRAVTLYFNQEDLMDQSLNDMYPYVLNGDILVMPNSQRLIRSTRLVPFSDMIHKTDTFNFQVRQPYPLTARITQGSRLL